MKLASGGKIKEPLFTSMNPNLKPGKIFSIEEHFLITFKTHAAPCKITKPGVVVKFFDANHSTAYGEHQRMLSIPIATTYQSPGKPTIFGEFEEMGVILDEYCDWENLQNQDYEHFRDTAIRLGTMCAGVYNTLCIKAWQDLPKMPAGSSQTFFLPNPGSGLKFSYMYNKDGSVADPLCKPKGWMSYRMCFGYAHQTFNKNL